MRHRRTLRFGVVLALGAVVAVAFVAAAGAGQIFQETFHEETVEIETDFCGVTGLTVEFARIVDGRVHAVPHGRDQLAYFGAKIEQTETVTNVADDDKFVTSSSVFIDKDLRVTDNGDGTLTLLILTTGNAVLYGSDGKAIARNPGQTRVEILIDHGGTPTDPSDDEFLEFLGVVKESTGRTDDFCEAAVPLLT
jgi:hypothetical protein